MKPIPVRPDSKDQSKTVKADFKVSKVPVELEQANLPDHVSKSVEKSIKQFEAGKTISLEEFKRKHFSK